MSTHARNSPSDSKRWLSCAGALNRCRKLGLNKDNGRVNTAADEGTAAHSIREMCLEIGLDAYHFIDTQVQVNGVLYTCDDAMAEALQPGIDRIREFAGKLLLEERVDITHIVGLDEEGRRQTGSLDAAIIPSIDEGDEAVLSDLKYGRGVPVQAVGNTQQILYGGALWKIIKKTHPHIKSLRIIIDQPRNNQGGGEWVISIDELLRRCAEIKEKAALTFDPNAPCTPTEDGCTWCPAAKIDGACPEYEEWNLNFCDIEFENLDEYDEIGMPLTMARVEGLNIPRKRAIYDHLHVIRAFLKRVEASVAEAVRDGKGDLYGKKIVAGKRSRRKHIDEDASHEWLSNNGFEDEDITVTKLKTPAQLDKVCGRGKFPEELFSGGKKMPVIVPMEDDRPAMVVDLDFENLDDESDDFED